MSDFLGNCLRNAIIVAFGVAFLYLIFMIVTVAIAGAVAGGGSAPAQQSLLPCPWHSPQLGFSLRGS